MYYEDGTQSKCDNCPFLYDDCDGEESVHVCHNPEYMKEEE